MTSLIAQTFIEERLFRMRLPILLDIACALRVLSMLPPGMIAFGISA
jgi:DNA-binding CsgD family transcriptional regulator